MSTNLNTMKSPGGGLELGDPKLGPHYSRLVGFAYIGVHERMAWKGEAKSPCGKSILVFELLDDFCEIDGVQKPRWISKKENAFSSQNSNLTKIYNSLDAAGTYQGAFDKMVTDTIPCMITIEPRKDSSNNPIDGVRIGGIGPVAPTNTDGTPLVLPPAANPVIIFDFDAPTAESYASLKPWMQKLVKGAQDFPGSACERIAADYDAQQAAAQAAAPTATTASQAQPLAQPTVVTAPAPVQQQAPAPVANQPITPAAPPGYRYDAATNSFVIDNPAALGGAPAGSGSPY